MNLKQVIVVPLSIVAGIVSVGITTAAVNLYLHKKENDKIVSYLSTFGKNWREEPLSEIIVGVIFTDFTNCDGNYIEITAIPPTNNFFTAGCSAVFYNERTQNSKIKKSAQNQSSNEVMIPIFADGSIGDFYLKFGIDLSTYSDKTEKKNGDMYIFNESNNYEKTTLYVLKVENQKKTIDTYIQTMKNKFESNGNKGYQIEVSNLFLKNFFYGFNITKSYNSTESFEKKFHLKYIYIYNNTWLNDIDLSYYFPNQFNNGS